MYVSNVVMFMFFMFVNLLMGFFLVFNCEIKFKLLKLEGFFK